jgi:hypothetical protein
MQGKQSEQAKMSVPAAKSVEQAEIKTEPCVVSLTLPSSGIQNVLWNLILRNCMRD